MEIVFKDYPADDLRDTKTDTEELYKVVSSGLPGRSHLKKEIVEEAFRGSSSVLAAYADGRLAGCIRVLSDGLEWAVIPDLCVLPEFQGRGIGSGLLKRILERYKGQEIFSFCPSQTISFFEKNGFYRSKNAFTYAGEEEEALNPFLAANGFYLPAGYRYETEFYPFCGDFPVGRKSSFSASAISVTYSQKFRKEDALQINSLLEKAFGGQREPAITERAFRESRYCQFAFDKDKMIGCARAVSDGCTQGFILNVAVDPAYQGIHLGWNVVSGLADQMKGQNIFLNTHPGGVGFYNRPGFRRNKTALLYPAHADMPEEIRKGFTLPAGYRFIDEF